MSETDKSWHASFKPHFTATNGLVYMSNGEGVGSDAGWTTEALIVDDRGVNVVALTSLQGSVNQVSEGLTNNVTLPSLIRLVLLTDTNLSSQSSFFL